MTTITTTARDGVYTVDVSGHAGYGPAGHDIVCAGISGACYVIAETARALSAAGLANLCDVQGAQGAFKALVSTQGTDNHVAAECWYNGALGAFMTIQAQYPDHVRVMGGVAHG